MSPLQTLSPALNLSLESLVVVLLASPTMQEMRKVCVIQLFTYILPCADEPTDVSGLSGSASQNPEGVYDSRTSSGLNTGTSHVTNRTLGTGNSSNQPIKEKVRQTFGIGGSDKYGTGLGGRTEGPGYGTASKHDRDGSRLGSIVGHGSNPDRYLYNSRNAPGIGGHRLGDRDDFTDSNTRHEGADSLPSDLGSDAAAGNAKHSSSSSGGIVSALSSAASNLTSGTGHNRVSQDETTSQAGAGQHQGTDNRQNFGTTRDTGSFGDAVHDRSRNSNVGTSGGQSNVPSAEATAADGSGGHREPAYDNSRLSNTTNLAERDSRVGGVSGGAFGGAAGSSLTGSHTTRSGAGASGGNSGLVHDACAEGKSLASKFATRSLMAIEREGYQPHGGHPIGEAAHSTDDGKRTWLDYRNNPALPISRGKPADL